MTRPSPLIGLLAAVALAGCATETTCPGGESVCDGQCVPLASDPRHCGACGHACGTAETCSAASCECAAGTSRCGGACVSLTDSANCGACGLACGGTDVCGTVDGAPTCLPTCGAGTTLCGVGCADLQTSRLHCGACGRACQAGEACSAGACRSVQVACFASDDVRSIAPDLASSGAVKPAGDGPIALAALGGDVWAAASLSGSLVRIPLDQAGAAVEFALHGNDFEAVAAFQERLYLSSSTAGSVVVADPATGLALDEIAIPGQLSPNPRAIAFAGGRAYLTLYGKDAASGGQALAVLDLAAPGPCSASGPRCATLASTLDLRAGADAPGLPFPGHAVAVGAKVYVTLSNLKRDEVAGSPTFGFYVLPAGNGKLAVIDTAAGDAVTYRDLGAACANPGSLALQGTTLWISCAAFGATGLLPVELSSGAPVVGPIVDTALLAPGNVAFCAGMGFVTDQYSGDVVRFDPAGVGAQVQQTICPNGPQGWAWASDLLCATRP